MDKNLDNQFVINSFSTVKEIEYYWNASHSDGLWESEKLIFKKYLSKANNLLDLGCGIGRVSLSLYSLGFTNIIGLDLTPNMIKHAREKAKELNFDITYVLGDAQSMPFKQHTFDCVIHSFNGLMMIPTLKKKERVLNEVSRILRPKGLYIFTTHLRDSSNQYDEFWKKEHAKWKLTLNDQRLDKYGDIIFKNKDSHEQYIHIPVRSEIEELLNTKGFELVEIIERSKIAEEPDWVKEFSSECNFWVFKKVD